MADHTAANQNGTTGNATSQDAGGLHPSNELIPQSGNSTGIFINATMTAHTSTQGGEGGEGGSGVPGGVIALLVCLLLVGIAVFIIVFYLKRSGKLYKMVPFKPLTSRRSSFSCSERALHEVDTQDTQDSSCPVDDSPASRRREGGRLHPPQRPGDTAMFTIEDHDMDSVDITDRGATDEYFYDEVFGTSVFEDEATNASMRQLYLASDEADEDMMDVDALVDSITGNGNKAKNPKT